MSSGEKDFKLTPHKYEECKGLYTNVLSVSHDNDFRLRCE
jgi:hypothetical protein